MRLSILGCRGSIPVSGEGFTYGCATSCYLLECEAGSIIIDAGSGLINLPPDKLGDEIYMLLSHAHADHIMGFPMWGALYDPKRRITVYGAERSGMDIRAQLRHYMSPPVWPITDLSFRAEITWKTAEKRFHCGAAEIITAELNHPGGALGYRIECEGRSLVYISDTELDTDCTELAGFAGGCDLLLCDGQYLPGEKKAFKGFGHSSYTAAVELAEAAGAKRTLIIHHSPQRPDCVLDAVSLPDAVAFAREGMTVEL